MTDYLTVIEVLAIHLDQIDRYGGSDGLRDPGSLEAALFRPQTGYYADLIDQAAALWESLAQNHPFIDGNKRAALIAIGLFLKLNGFNLRAPQLDAFQTILKLAAGSLEEVELADWLTAHIVPR